MGTWDTGPFDNDTAADFGGDLDEAAREERKPLIRGVLVLNLDHGLAGQRDGCAMRVMGDHV
ncbi:DUF4259 domain-containing protein [Streptomyces yangpuensis]|uniref:DUF4259 domain-containing protein n=1 Tax=Streptomyces yangpuensis TaxID=1648182 RepID=UPI003564ABAE